MKIGRADEPTDHYQYFAKFDMHLNSHNVPISQWMDFGPPKDAKQWCIEKFGSDFANWRWTKTDDTFWFQDEKDLMLFLLRFGK
jgi:hypothetical protein